MSCQVLDDVSACQTGRRHTSAVLRSLRLRCADLTMVSRRQRHHGFLHLHTSSSSSSTPSLILMIFRTCWLAGGWTPLLPLAFHFISMTTTMRSKGLLLLFLVLVVTKTPKSIMPRVGACLWTSMKNRRQLRPRFQTRRSICLRFRTPLFVRSFRSVLTQ